MALEPLILFPLIVLLLLVVDFFVAREFYKAAVMKGWTARKYFWLAFLLPPAGYLLVIALPDRGGAHMSVFESDDLPDI